MIEMDRNWNLTTVVNTLLTQIDMEVLQLKSTLLSEETSSDSQPTHDDYMMTSQQQEVKIKPLFMEQECCFYRYVALFSVVPNFKGAHTYIFIFKFQSQFMELPIFKSG